MHRSGKRRCVLTWNPHCAQLKDQPERISALHLTLNHTTDDCIPFVPRMPGELRSTVHRGQRKLLMSEIAALNKLDPATKYTLVYAGAAPGIHIPFLSSLFPNVTFHLYDPSVFEIPANDKIRLYRCYFTDLVAESFAETANLVFICDIRRDPREQFVLEDMLAQQRWHNIMKPVLTSLKFRLPWPTADADFDALPEFDAKLVDDNLCVTYLNGEIHLPIWGRQSTTECRLVIAKGVCPSTRQYDCVKYEQQMSFFNRRTRPSIYKAQFVPGLDSCFDCTAEVAVLTEYVRRAGEKNICDSVKALSLEISYQLGVEI